jgi:hypothetical protein
MYENGGDGDGEKVSGWEAVMLAFIVVVIALFIVVTKFYAA